MARGSQEEKGKIADLVEKVIKRIKRVREGRREEVKEKKEGEFSDKRAINRRKKPSPIRFMRTVKRPE